jgi:ParB-like chromosome segregation protein Spo0J
MTDQTDDRVVGRIDPPTDFEFHEACQALPAMSSEEFESLVNDIRKCGLRRPIKTHKGKIIDGRHRLQACKAAGVEPRFEEWDGQNPDGKPGTVVDYVISANLERRHLTASQRGMIGAELVPIFEREAEERSQRNLKRGGQSPSGPVGSVGAQKESGAPIPPISGNEGGFPPSPTGDVGKSTEKAAKTVGSSPRTVQRAKRIKDQAPPGVSQKIKDGKMTIRAAERALRHSPSGLDLEGRPVPEHMRSLFDNSIRDHAAIFKGIDAAISGLKQLEGTVRGKHHQLRLQFELQAIRDAVTAGRPHAPCPICAPETPSKECQYCRGDGWLNTATYQAYLQFRDQP